MVGLMRKNPLVNNEVYHIYNSSIAKFKIFNDTSEFSRIIDVVLYYQRKKPETKFCKFIRSSKNREDGDTSFSDKEKLVEIIAYCFMPTHVHFILKQLRENGISIFMSNVCNSYARYFNTKHKRKGPLWEGRFKNVLVETDEQLLHLTRYIHLNPVTAGLCRKPEEWATSSYREYVSKVSDSDRICRYDGLLDIDSSSYRKFVEDRISYQKELAKIKSTIIEKNLSHLRGGTG